MALAILCRRTNSIKNIKNFILRQIVDKRIIQPRIISTNANSNFIQQKQIRWFSLTQPKYSDSEESNGGYVTHWIIERMLSVSMLIIYPLAFLSPSTRWDYLIILTTIVHIHMGLDSIVVDYIRPISFGKQFIKMSQALVVLFSLSLLVGLIHFTRNDVGIVTAIKQLWAIKGGEERDQKCACHDDEESKDSKSKK